MSSSPWASCSSSASSASWFCEEARASRPGRSISKSNSCQSCRCEDFQSVGADPRFASPAPDTSHRVVMTTTARITDSPPRTPATGRAGSADSRRTRPARACARSRRRPPPRATRRVAHGRGSKSRPSAAPARDRPAAAAGHTRLPAPWPRCDSRLRRGPGRRASWGRSPTASGARSAAAEQPEGARGAAPPTGPRRPPLRARMQRRCAMPSACAGAGARAAQRLRARGAWSGEAAAAAAASYPRAARPARGNSPCTRRRAPRCPRPAGPGTGRARPLPALPGSGASSGALLEVTGETRAKLQARAMDLVLHLLQAPAHRLGDLAIPQAVIDAHEQRGPSLMVEVRERSVQHAVRLQGQQHRLGAGTTIGPRGLFGRFRHGAFAPFPADLLEEDHPGDPEEPTLQLARLLERPEPPVRAQERLLGTLVRPRVVAEQIAQEPAHAWSFPIEDHSKRLRIARTRARQQLLIGIPVAGAKHLAR